MAMIPNQGEYEIFGMGQTRMYMCVTLPLLHPFSSSYLPAKLNWTELKMQTELSNKYPVKVVPHWPFQAERGFSGLRYLSDSQIIPLQIPIAL